MDVCVLIKDLQMHVITLQFNNIIQKMYVYG